MIRTLLALALVAGVLGACGSDDGGEDTGANAILHGETETGMKLEVEPVIDPVDDPLLAELDEYREAVGAPPVFYTRVTADNTDGRSADSGRVLDFASDPETLQMEGGIRTRFTCEALEFEWIPPADGEPALRDTYDDLRERLCENGPPQPDGIEPGMRQVYYVFVEQVVETQDLAEQRVFGPRSEELLP